MGILYMYVTVGATQEVILRTTRDGDLDHEGNSLLYMQELAKLFYTWLCCKAIPGHHDIDVKSHVPVLRVPSINQDTGQGLGLVPGPVLVRQCQEDDGLILDLRLHHAVDTTALGLVLQYPGEGDTHLTGGM